MKRAIILFWKGLTGIIAATAEWFTVILGMKDESKYGKFIRRVVGGSFSFIMFAFACVTAGAFFNAIYNKVVDHTQTDHSYSYSQYLSRDVSYYGDGYVSDGYVETRDGKRTVKNILWIAKPLGNDSMVCYSNGKVRGYFNMLTGDLTIKPKYKHAWIFSDGLASVDDDGWIKFIDSNGNVAIDPKIPYIPGADGYVFHNNHCVLHSNKRDKFGMIDKQGNWVMKAEYDRIQPVDSFWIVSKGGKQCIISESMKVVMPFIDANLWVSGNKISAEMADHTLRYYDLQGNLTDDFLISGINNLLYETGELRYDNNGESGDEYNPDGETGTPLPVYKTARCKRYEAASGWYGLMTQDGKVLTAPKYTEISAIGYDLYFCRKGYASGEVVNGKGIKVK